MPYFSNDNIVEGKEVVGYQFNCVLFLRLLKSTQKNCWSIYEAASPMWQAFLTLVVPAADLGIADMMNCLQDQFHKLF